MEARKNKYKYFVLASSAVSGGIFQVWPRKVYWEPSKKVCASLKRDRQCWPPHSPSFHLKYEHVTWTVIAFLWPQSNRMRIKSKNGEDGVVEMNPSPQMHHQLSKPMPETTFLWTTYWMKNVMYLFKLLLVEFSVNWRQMHSNWITLLKQSLATRLDLHINMIMTLPCLNSSIILHCL